MLKEDQVIELLSNCESVVGKKLAQIRGNLQHPESRAAAIWELIGIEEYSRHGPVNYEPEGASRPDIVFGSDEGKTAIEFTYLYPRFWRNEQKRYQIYGWIRETLEANSIPLKHLRISFDGERSADGYKQKLPDLHEKSTITKHENLLNFIKITREHSNLDVNIRLDPFDIKLFHEPSECAWNFSSGGTIEEQGMEAERTAIFRKVREKSYQHKLRMPLLLCIAGDERSAIASQFKDRSDESAIIGKAFKKFRNVSGVCLTSFEWPVCSDQLRPLTYTKIVVNRWAKYPFNSDFIALLNFIDFNRWSYTFSLPKWDLNSMDERETLGANLQVRDIGGGRSILSVPAQLILDSLQGKSNVLAEYGSKEGDFPHTFFELDWEIVDVNFKSSKIEKGTDNLVELTLTRRKPRVFRN